MTKKGQISLFLLVAVVIFIVLIIIFFPKLEKNEGGVVVETTQQTQIDLTEVEDYIKQIMLLSIEESLNEIQKKGFILGPQIKEHNNKILAVSFTPPEKKTLYPYVNFTFPPKKRQALGKVELQKLCDITGENAPRLNSAQIRTCERQLYDTKPPTDYDIQSQIRSVIKFNITKLITVETLNNLVKGDYEITGEPEIRVLITENTISAILDWDIKGTKGETSHTISEVTTTKQTNLPLMYTLAYKAVLNEIEDINFNIETDYTSLVCPDFSKSNSCAKDLYLKKYPIDSKGFYKYEITNKKQTEKIEFYIQNRNPVIEDLPQGTPIDSVTPRVSLQVFQDEGEINSIMIKTRDPDDKNITNIRVGSTAISGICKDIIDEIVINENEIQVTLINISDKKENCPDYGNGNAPEDCKGIDEPYGRITDGLDNDLICNLFVEIEDEAKTKDITFFTYAVQNIGFAP